MHVAAQRGHAGVIKQLYCTTERSTMTKTGLMKTASTTTRTISTRRSKKNRHLRRSLISRRCCRTPSTRTSSRFRRNRPVPVARSLAEYRKIKSGRHMTGAMCHSPRESRRRRRLHQAPKKDSRRRWCAWASEKLVCFAFNKFNSIANS